jgi:putative membrane protein
MVASLVFGGVMLADRGQALWQDGWMQAKLVVVAGLVGMHMAMARWRKDFAEDRNTRPQAFYRIANEVPTVLMIGAVILVVVKPF